MSAIPPGLAIFIDDADFDLTLISKAIDEIEKGRPRFDVGREIMISALRRIAYSPPDIRSHVASAECIHISRIALAVAGEGIINGN